MIKQLRPYQKNAIESVFSNYEIGIGKQLILIATGAGKTFIAGNIIKELPMRLACGGRVLWLTHEEPLIDQSARAVMSVLFPEMEAMINLFVGEAGGIVNFMSADHNLFGSPDCANVYSLLKRNLGIIKQKMFNIQPNLVVASVQTIINRLDKIPAGHFDMIVVDETHFALAKSWTTVLDHFSPKIRLGLTATGERLDGQSLGDLYDKVVAEYDIKQGVDDGNLCEIEAISIRTGISLDTVRTTGHDLNQKDLRVVDCDSRNNLIVEKWLMYAESEEVRGVYRPTIAFCVDTEHAIHLSQAFQAHGCKATFIASDPKDQANGLGKKEWDEEVKNRIKRWKQKEVDVLCVVNMLVYGFDFPNIGCTISACPTKSKIKFLQGPIGRGTRKKDEWFIKTFGKSNLIVLDITDNAARHQLVNTFTLENGLRLEDRVFMGKERKQSLIDQRDKRMLEHNQERDERNNLLKLPQVKIAMDAPWMRDEATEAQLKWVASRGYDIVENRYTKGQCNAIINGFEASDKKKLELMNHGYDVSGGVTNVQYDLAKKEIDKKMEAGEVANSPLFKNSPIKGLC